jgi:hypothetical protein
MRVAISGMEARAYNQTALWRHFQGAIFCYSNPGLRPWAILLCHFMALGHPPF